MPAVNGEAISPSEIRVAVSELRAAAEASGEQLALQDRLQLRDRALELLIDRRLMEQEAIRLGIATAGCGEGADRAQSIAERLAAHWSTQVKPPRPSEVKEFYRNNRQQFQSDERVHARHIVKNVGDFDDSGDVGRRRGEVEAMRNRVLAGENFSAVARDSSDCPENGGDLGYFPRGVMVDAFDNVVFAAPLHEITPVFQTSFGFHFAQVLDRRPAGIRPLDEVSQIIGSYLLQRLQEFEVETRMQALRAKAVITA